MIRNKKYSIKEFIEINISSLDGEYFEYEMILNSLFDDSFCFKPKGLVINNGCLEILGIKHEDKFLMFIRAISLNKGKEKFDLSFLEIDSNFEMEITEKKFELCKRKYERMGIDIINFPN